MSNCRFRRQHEQLRQVIARVLRPATSAALPAAVVSPDIQPAPETLAVDTTDSNSIDVSYFKVVWNVDAYVIYSVRELCQVLGV